MKNKKYCVVTFLFNHYDLLREPLVIDEKADYYCITDDFGLKSENWKILYIKEFDTDKLSGVQKTYMAKYSFHKYIPNSYQYYFTIDASLEICGSLSPIIDYMAHNNYEIGLAMHPERDVWKDEYKCWIINRGLDKKYYNIFENFAKISSLNSNEKTGLIECTVKIYKNSETVIKFIEEVYCILKKCNNFEDKNDQCYFTCVFKKYDEKLKSLFFYRQLYSNSKYFYSYYHNTNN